VAEFKEDPDPQDFGFMDPDPQKICRSTDPDPRGKKSTKNRRRKKLFYS